MSIQATLIRSAGNEPIKLLNKNYLNINHINKNDRVNTNSRVIHFLIETNTRGYLR